jgi:hypothetical protein
MSKSSNIGRAAQSSPTLQDISHVLQGTAPSYENISSFETFN